jgi:anti-sigma B factor antagonist
MPVVTPTLLQITVRHAAGTALIALEGELDLATAPQLDETLEELGDQPVIVDLRELEYCDSVGLRLLLRRDAEAQEHGRRVAVVPGHAPAVERVFALTNAQHKLHLI